MFKKLTAGIVAVSILSVSSMALAGTPKRNHQADFPASKPVWAKPHFNAAHRGKAAGAPLQQPRIPKAANELEMLQKRAEKLGIDISGLSADEIRAKIMEAMKGQNTANMLDMLKKRAEKLGIDISGLSADEIKAKIAEVMDDRKAADMLDMLKKITEKLGINISGFSADEIKAKITEVMKEQNAANMFDMLKKRVDMPGN